jgi:hypothetical protein
VLGAFLTAQRFCGAGVEKKLALQLGNSRKKKFQHLINVIPLRIMILFEWSILSIGISIQCVQIGMELSLQFYVIDVIRLFKFDESNIRRLDSRE